MAKKEKAVTENGDALTTVLNNQVCSAPAPGLALPATLPSPDVWSAHLKLFNELVGGTGEGFVPPRAALEAAGLSPDRTYVGTSGNPSPFHGVPSGPIAWTLTDKGVLLADVGRLIQDLAADAQAGLSSIDLPSVKHGHWKGIMGARDLVLLTNYGPGGGSSLVSAAEAQSAMAIGGKTYADFVAGVHKALTRGI